MTQDKNCDNCVHSDRCSEIYERLGRTKGPSVVSKVVLAFLLPIIIFIVTLAVCQLWLKSVFDSENIITGVGAIIALFTVLIYIFTVRSFCNRQSSSKGILGNAECLIAKGEQESKL